MKSIFSKICLQASLAVIFAGEALAQETQMHISPLTLEEAFGVHMGHVAPHVEEYVEHAEKSVGLPQLDPTWYASQLFWLVLVFGILYAFFTKAIIPALSGTIETRRERVQEDLEKAAKMKDEAEKVHTAYEEVLSEARARASEFFTETEDKIKAKSDKKLNSLRDKAAKKTQEVEANLQRAKQEALKDMDTVAAEVASMAAEKIVGISTDVKQAKSVVDSINKKAA